MFRENILTDDEIIDRIASTMVPVAVDRVKAEDPKTKEAKFLQPFLKKNPAQGSPCIYSAEGKVLGAFQGYDWGRMLPLINESLKAFGPVKPREVKPVETHPHRGKGVMRDGSVSLAEYIRTSEEDLKSVHPKSPVISSVTLSEEEFRAFAPQEANVGARWALPNDVAKKLSRASSPLCYQHAPQPDWVTDVRLNAEVQAFKEGAAWVRYEGRIASAHRVRGTTVSDHEVELTGYGVYDLKAKRMRSLLLVGSGSVRWPEDPKKRVTFDALVEWNLEVPEPLPKR
jgi:hypothetical protein